MLQLQPSSVLQPVQVCSLVSLAGLHRDSPGGQRHQTDGDSHRLQGLRPIFRKCLVLNLTSGVCNLPGSVWKVQQWTGSRVCQRRSGGGKVALLNIQPLAKVCPQQRWESI